MMKRFLSGLVLWGAFAASFGTAVYIQSIGVKQVLKNSPFYDTWQLGGNSGETMKLFALQYDQVAADFLWLRAIQSFGGRGMSSRDWRPLYNQFQTMTDLDPYFSEAYTFGNLVIGDEGGHHRPGLTLLDKGTFKVFRQYRIPFEATYAAHWQMKREDLARWYGLMASKREDAPEWVTRMVAYIDVNAGQYYIGLDRFVGNLMQAIDAEEPAYEDIAMKKSAETIEKWNAERFLLALDEFTTATGRLPNSIDELATMPALQQYETADMGKLLAGAVKYTEALNLKPIPDYLLDLYAPLNPEVLAKPITRDLEGKKMQDLQDLVFQDSLTTVTGIPPSSTGKPYAINLTRLPHLSKFEATDVFVPMDKLEQQALESLTQMRFHISERKRELGRNPASLDEVFYTDFKTTEPFGGQWLYDPNTGKVQMSSRPML